MNFDFDYDHARSSFLVRVVVLLFPAILLWLFSLVGLTVPLQNFGDWVLILIYWSLVEFFVMLYFLGDIKNKKDIVKRLFLNWGVVKLFADWFFFAGGGSMLEEDLNKEDSYRIQYAGIAFFSMLLPWIAGTICLILVYALFSGLS